MSWVRLDDGFADHPKIVGLTDAAFRLHITSLCYAARHLTDGAVPRRAIDRLGITQPAKRARELVDAGLWEVTDDGWSIHDYLEYQPSAEHIRQERTWSSRRRELHNDAGLIAAIRGRDQDLCRYCGRKVSWKDRRSAAGATYDHVQPRGDNSLENVVVACRGCNSSKGPRTPEEAGLTLLPPPDRSVPGTDPEQNGIGSMLIRSSHPSPSPSQLKSQSSATTSRAAAGLDDDDGLAPDLIEAVVALKVAGQNPTNPGPYRAAVARTVPDEHGATLRQILLEHPAWPTNWVAQEALGRPRTDPTPRQVIDACPDCTNSLVETPTGMAPCPSCSWARNGNRTGPVT